MLTCSYLGHTLNTFIAAFLPNIGGQMLEHVFFFLGFTKLMEYSLKTWMKLSHCQKTESMGWWCCQIATTCTHTSTEWALKPRRPHLFFSALCILHRNHRALHKAARVCRRRRRRRWKDGRGERKWVWRTTDAAKKWWGRCLGAQGETRLGNEKNVCERERF